MSVEAGLMSDVWSTCILLVHGMTWSCVWACLCGWWVCVHDSVGGVALITWVCCMCRLWWCCMVNERYATSRYNAWESELVLQVVVVCVVDDSWWWMWQGWEVEYGEREQLTLNARSVVNPRIECWLPSIPGDKMASWTPASYPGTRNKSFQYDSSRSPINPRGGSFE